MTTRTGQRVMTEMTGLSATWITTRTLRWRLGPGGHAADGAPARSCELWVLGHVTAVKPYGMYGIRDTGLGY